MTLRQRLLSAPPCYGIPDAGLSPADLGQLIAWRRERLCRRMSGPGPAYWELTKIGRIELAEPVTAWRYREDF
jgi:hypothetical protein